MTISLQCYVDICRLVAGMAQWLKRSKPTNVFRVRFPDPVVYVCWVCQFTTLLPEVFFFRFLWFFPVSKTNIWFDLIWVSLPNNSGGLDLSADGPVFKKNSLIFYFRTGVDVLPQNIESSLNIFSDSFFFTCMYLSCHVLLAEFRTSVNLTGFN